MAVKKKRQDSWEITVRADGGMGDEGRFKPKKEVRTGKRYLDFGIRKSDYGKGYVVDHIPTGRLAHRHGLAFGRRERAMEFVQALYELGSWDSAKTGDYKDRKDAARAIMDRFAI